MQSVLGDRDRRQRIADGCIEHLSLENAELREQAGTLIDLLVDVSIENVTLRCLFARQYVERIHGDKTIALLQWKARRQHAQRRRRHPSGHLPRRSAPPQPPIPPRHAPPAVRL